MTTEPAYALVHSDPPEVFLADTIETLNWVLAVRLVARDGEDRLGRHTAEVLKHHLMEEQWGEAVLTWIEATNTPVDVYPGITVHTAASFPVDVAAAELQFTPLFRGHGSTEDDAD